MNRLHEGSCWATATTWTSASPPVGWPTCGPGPTRCCSARSPSRSCVRRRPRAPVHEAVRSAALMHTNIATVFDYRGRTRVSPSSSWSSSPASRSRLNQRGPLPPSEVRSIMGQAALALGVAHEARVVHPRHAPSRPTSWCATTASVKLTDFGIAVPSTPQPRSTARCWAPRTTSGRSRPGPRATWRERPLRPRRRGARDALGPAPVRPGRADRDGPEPRQRAVHHCRTTSPRTCVTSSSSASRGPREATGQRRRRRGPARTRRPGAARPGARAGHGHRRVSRGDARAEVDEHKVQN